MAAPSTPDPTPTLGNPPASPSHPTLKLPGGVSAQGAADLGDTLNQPAPGAAADSAGTSEGAIAGLPEVPGFQLQREVARGGMGVIFQARDLAMNRTVAVKLLHERYPADSPIAARFVEEAHITGQLQHPGIPPIYQVGKLADGRPFLAMKLIKGQTLDALLKAETVFNKLAVFEAIAQAVGYAHAHGVIHRDLKPQNVMVGAFGEVQVMDWGLAKLLGTARTNGDMEAEGKSATSTTFYDPRAGSDGIHTQAGSVLGTLAYMPPEQAAGEIAKIDPRADVFGLGAVLCQMLTGQPPFTGKDAESLRVAALRGKTEEAFTRLDGCGAEPDVVNLCKRCLAFETADRPSDGNAVAAAVAKLRAEAEERAKQAELAQARAEVQAAEQRKRRRVVLVGAAVLLLAFGASLWQWNKAVTAEGVAKENERRVNAERDLKELQRERAEQNERLAEDRLVQVEGEKKKVEAEKQKVEEEKRIATAVNDFLQYKLLAQGDPKQQADRLLRLGQQEEPRDPDPKLSVLLARAAAELAPDKIEANFPNQPLLQAELLQTVGMTYAAIGGKDNDQYALAITFLQRSADLQQQHLGADHPDTLAALHNLAGAYLFAGRLPEAIKLYEQVREAIVTKLGADHPSMLTTLNNLALAYRDAGRLPEAIELHEQVREARVAMLGPDHPDTLTTLHNLAGAYHQAGRLPEAIKLYEQVRDAEVPKLGSDHPDTLTTLNNLALAYQAAGRLPEAIQLYEQVRDASVAKLGPDHPDTLATLHNLALAYRDAGRLPEAIRLLEQVRNAQVPKLGADHPDTLTTLANLAGAHQAAGRLPEAIQLYEQVRAARVAKLGPDHPDTLATLHNLALAYRDAGRLPEAIRLLEQVRNAQVPKLGTDHPYTLTTLVNLALAYRDAGRLPEAIQLYEQVRDAQLIKLSPDHPDTLTTLAGLAVAYHRAGRLPEALSLFEQAAVGIENRQFQHEYARGIISTTIGAYDEARQFDKADKWRRKWLPVIKRQAGADSPAYADELASLGLSQLQRQHWSEAETPLRECHAIRQKTQPDAWTTFNTQSMLGGALLGRAKSADDDAEKAKLFAEAEPLLLKGYEGIQARLVSPGSDPQIITAQKLRLGLALDRLIDLYTAWDKPEEVKKWQAEKAARER